MHNSGAKFLIAPMPKVLLTGIYITCLLLTGNVAGAHSGGLDSQGCHGGSRPYHCHRSPSEMVRTQDGRNRLRCDLGSRSRECVSRSSPNVLKFQRQLMRHCEGLPNNFVDGKAGPATKRALRRFQLAYGLVPDGVYGPKTAEALRGKVNGRCR